MTLRTCRSCEGEVDSKAKACLRCGRRTPYGDELDRIARWLVVLIIAVAIGTGIVLVFRHNQEQAKKDACRATSQIVSQKCPR